MRENKRSIDSGGDVKRIGILLVLALANLSYAQTTAQAQRWSEQKANSWYQQQPWVVGSNYVPADAINELEMWQESTFNLPQIDKEFGWAEGLGINRMGGFLHAVLWQQDAEGFHKRIDACLA